jgi:hypothetical protein
MCLLSLVAFFSATVERPQMRKFFADLDFQTALAWAIPFDRRHVIGKIILAGGIRLGLVVRVAIIFAVT